MHLEFLEIGKIIKPHGVKGEVSMETYSFNHEDLKKISNLYIGAKNKEKFLIKSVRTHKQRALVVLEGIDNFDKAKELVNRECFIKREDIHLNKGEYLTEELKNCRVLDYSSKEEYGILKDVSNYGAGEIWHVVKNGKETLVPIVPGTFKSADIDKE